MDRASRTVAAAIAALVAIGCGGPNGPSSAPPTDQAPGPSPDDGAGSDGAILGDGEVVYDCYGVEATADLLESAPRLDELDHPGRAAFDEHAAGSPEEWIAVVVDDGRLAAIRELPEPDELDGDVRDHERLEVTLFEADELPDQDLADGGRDGTGGWEMTSAGPCALRADLGALGPASVAFDGEAPEADATTLELLVTEQACASGQEATDRVVTEVEATEDELRLVVGVTLLGGEAECPSNPPTSIQVELDEPLGDREVVDATRYPVRALPPT